MSPPELLEYNQAIQDPRICFRDPELRGGRPRVDAFDQPQPCTGNCAAIYEMRQPGAKDAWAVKCFIRDVEGLKDRYRAISEHLSRAKRSGFGFAVDFQFLDDGILVNGAWHPVLKMRWVDGTNLNQFVKDNAQRPAMLSALATLWLRMAGDLRAAKMAHGDLQHGNVLLLPNTVQLRLIDYDGMFVPALAGTKSNEIGHRNYQHPQRVDDPYHGEIDRFSHMVIWTALHCVMSTGRALWDRYDSGENLLFREEDFQSPGSSQLFQEAWKISEPTAHALVGRLVLACLGSARDVPLLGEIAPNGQAVGLTADEERRVVNLLAAGAKKGVRPPPKAAVVSRTRVARKPAPTAGARAGVKASTWTGRSASPAAFGRARTTSPAPAAPAAWPALARPRQVHWKSPRRRRISLPLGAAVAAIVAVVAMLFFVSTRAAKPPIAAIGPAAENMPHPVVPGQPISRPIAPQAPPNRAGANSPDGSSLGRQVSVHVQVVSPYGGDQKLAASRITEAFGACLERSGIQVVDGQSAVFRFRLRLSERATQNKPSYIVDSLLIELLAAGRPGPLWRKIVAVSTVRTNGTLDNALIDLLVQRLSTFAIPNDVLAPNENSNVAKIDDRRTVDGSEATNRAPGGIPGARSNASGAAPADDPTVPETKAPVPSADDLAAARRAVKVKFQQDLQAAKTPEQKLIVARKSQRAAFDEMADSPDRYALLDQARELAAWAGSSKVAFEAIDGLAREFEIDDLELRLATLEAAAKAPPSPTSKAARKEQFDSAKDLIAKCVAFDRFPEALRAAMLAQGAVRILRDQELAKHVAEQRMEIDKLAKAFAAVKDDVERLKSDAGDAAANLAVGKFYCLAKKDWERGLPHLAAGDDATLKDLAQRELAKPSGAEDEKSLGDAWWELGRKESGPIKAVLAGRACFWYRRAVTFLSGLEKDAVEQKLVEAKTQFLSELNEINVMVANNWFAKGRNAVVDKPLRVAGKESPHGLFAYPTSNGTASVSYELGKKANRLALDVAIDDGAFANPRTALVFQVWGDGLLLHSMGPVAVKGQVVGCELSVGNVKVLELRVICEGRNTSAQAVWLEPRVTWK